MKTPEEMAKKWSRKPRPNQDVEEYQLSWDLVCDWEKESFLAGYQAAQETYKVTVTELNANWTFCCKDKSRLLKELSKAEAAAPQWISVKDRLPEDISDVLILTKEKELCVGYYRSSDNDWNMYNPCCSFHMELHGVTHWMPLPTAPKEEV
jgi:hypothetical protein